MRNKILRLFGNLANNLLGIAAELLACLLVVFAGFMITLFMWRLYR